MTRHRHERRNGRHNRGAALVTAVLAVFATGAAVAIGVSGLDTDVSAVDAKASVGTLVEARDQTRQEARLSRSAGRRIVEQRTVMRRLSPVEQLLQPKAAADAVTKADRSLWTTEDLNLWTRPDRVADRVGLLETGKKILVTGRRFGEREEVVLGGKARWVTAGYLSSEKPDPGPTLGGECSNGTSVPSGVSSNIAAIHRAVCANWPEIITYGTLRADSADHGSGRAMDIMISGTAGREAAEFLRANYAAFGINYVIHAQEIWSVDRSGEGWRGMEDRGSVTANHYDHVHVSVY